MSTNQEGKHTPERYTMDLRDSAPKTPGYVHVVDNDTRKIVIMFSTSLEARLINDMFDFMRAWPSQSSELSKLREELRLMTQERDHWLEHSKSIAAQIRGKHTQEQQRWILRYSVQGYGNYTKLIYGTQEQMIDLMSKPGISNSSIIGPIEEQIIDETGAIASQSSELSALKGALREIQKSNAKIQILIAESDIDYEIFATSEEVQRQSKLISAALK